MSMMLEEESTGSEIALRVSGTVDLATADQLAARIGDLVDQTTTVVVDLSGVTFLDSTGIGALVQSHHLAQRNGSRLVVSGPTDDISFLLHLTGLDQVLMIRTS